MKFCKTCKIKKPITEFSIHKGTIDGKRADCKECLKIWREVYGNTEYVFISNMFENVRSSAKRHKDRNLFGKNLKGEEKEKYKCNMKREEFHALWEEHKKRFGYCCRLTGEKIICKRAKQGNSFSGYINSVSADRLNPEKGYTKENIIFISNDVNKMKGAVTKELCEKILEIYKEKNL